MNDTLQNWLDNPLLSSVHASCVRLPSGQARTQVAGADISNESFEQAMKCLAGVLPLLIDQGLMPGQVVWNFANGTLHYAVRPDGVALGLYCGPNSGIDAPAIGDFIADFMKGV
jgi:hypothetical protein